MTAWKLTSTRTDPAHAASVIFVHGFQGDPTATWSDFPRLLAEDSAMRGFDVMSFGYESDFAPDLSGVWEGDPDIQTIADSLRTFVRTTLTNHRAVVLMAHSMGGLVVQRALLDDDSFRERVDKVILFGTPSFGLRKAWPFRLPILSLLNRQVRDMAHGGAFITSLRNQWTERFTVSMPFEFLAVAGAEDEFVPRSASIAGFPDAHCAVVPGNHLQIVKARAAEDASYRVARAFLRGDGDVVESFGIAALSLERRQFQRVIDRFGPNRDSLDPRALVLLALALDAVGRRAESMQVLADAKRHGTDAMGVLAGRHKRNWLQERRAEDAEHALRVYREAYDASITEANDAQSYYHAINLAFLHLVYRAELEQASQWAGKALGHCAAARANEIPGHAYWRRATEAEALLIQGDAETAIARYRRAMEGPPAPEPWMLVSTSQQALRIADERRDEKAAKQLVDLFRGKR